MSILSAIEKRGLASLSALPVVQKRQTVYPELISTLAEHFCGDKVDEAVNRALGDLVKLAISELANEPGLAVSIYERMNGQAPKRDHLPFFVLARAARDRRALPLLHGLHLSREWGTTVLALRGRELLDEILAAAKKGEGENLLPLFAVAALLDGPRTLPVVKKHKMSFDNLAERPLALALAGEDIAKLKPDKKSLFGPIAHQVSAYTHAADAKDRVAALEKLVGLRCDRIHTLTVVVLVLCRALRDRDSSVVERAAQLLREVLPRAVELLDAVCLTFLEEARDAIAAGASIKVRDLLVEIQRAIPHSQPLLEEAPAKKGTGKQAWWDTLDEGLQVALLGSLDGPNSSISRTRPGEDVLRRVRELTEVSFEERQPRPESFAPLAELSGLEKISWTGGGFPTKTLASLTQLKALTAWDCGLSEIGFLRKLTRLESIDFIDVEIEDTAALVDLAELSFVQLHGLVNDSSGLQNKKKLEWLVVGMGPAFDTSRLTCLSALEHLHLLVATGRLPNLSFLSGLAALKHLELEPSDQKGTVPLTSLQGVEGKSKLRNLWVQRAPRLSDLRALAGAPDLQWLTLEECPAIADWSVLAELRSLEELHVQGCRKLVDLAPISGASALRKLDITKTGVSDLGPLTGCRALKELRLYHMPNAPVRGMEQVVALPGIKAGSLYVFPEELAPPMNKVLPKKHRRLLGTD